MNRRRSGTALAVAAVATAVIAAAASAGPSAQKQRVAFELRLVLATNKGTWTLIPLSAGPLKKDLGTLVGGGTILPPVIRNGQKVTVIIGKDVMTGKRGNLVLTQRVKSVLAARGETADTGTWKFQSGTGAYRGVTGGGGFAAVCCAKTGIVYAREEGSLTIP
jgi:hypothetical protein